MILILIPTIMLMILLTIILGIFIIWPLAFFFFFYIVNNIIEIFFTAVSYSQYYCCFSVHDIYSYNRNTPSYYFIITWYHVHYPYLQLSLLPFIFEDYSKNATLESCSFRFASAIFEGIALPFLLRDYTLQCLEEEGHEPWNDSEK